MTVADVVAQVRDGRLEDFVRGAVGLVARQRVEAEISAEVGAELGEVLRRDDARGRLACRVANTPGIRTIRRDDTHVAWPYG